MADRIGKFKKSIIYLFLIFLSAKTFSQSYNIDYYGIVSTEIDANMSKMTSDLYYTQLSEINNFTVTDKRDDTALTQQPDPSIFSEETLSFYTIIEKDKDSEQWIATINVINKKAQEKHTKQKKYDSFYKILMESKVTLKETIKQLIESNNSVSLNSSNTETVSFSSENNDNTISTENLSGTWSGEENIDKIVILRGGRGFVIFKNGASMNITVENKDNQIVITQKGRSNASFYPELERNTALNAALSADPIEWILKFTDLNTLSGIKNTLLPDGDNYKKGTVKVNWKKVN